MMKKTALLTLAGCKFSLSIEQIRHVLPAQHLFPLVCLRQEIAGVFLYDDEPVPMLALSKLPELNLPDAATGSEYVIVFQSEFGNVGLPVDSAVTIVDAEDGFFEDLTQSDQEAHGGHVFHFQGVRYPLLDINEILARLPY